MPGGFRTAWEQDGPSIMIEPKKEGLRMPLRDHFHPPLDKLRSWQAVHAMWPAQIVERLNPKLPQRYIAEPLVRPGLSIEVDVATFENEGAELQSGGGEFANGGGVATAVWAPPKPTLTIPTDLPSRDEYEVRVYDLEAERTLVAVVEIVSPANKDRPKHRHAFVAKCLALLQARVCVVIVDIVTSRAANLYSELLEHIEPSDPALIEELPSLQAVTCRCTKQDEAWMLQTWAYPLTLGQPLPTLPIWLADNLAIPLELEPSYEGACRALRIPLL
jgi:hypothetical protein